MGSEVFATSALVGATTITSRVPANQTGAVATLKRGERARIGLQPPMRTGSTRERQQSQAIPLITAAAAAGSPHEAIVHNARRIAGRARDWSASRRRAELRFSWWGGGERHEAMLKAARLFEAKNPGVKIKAEYSGLSGAIRSGCRRRSRAATNPT